MKEITEDYVSFETAKLLKEKGFDVVTNTSYVIDNYKRPFVKVGDFLYNIPIGPHLVAAPTLALAMKWLREVHNLCVAPYAAALRYGFTIDKADTGSNIGNEKTLSIPDYSEITTWEQACEVAIKYCLENLI